MHICFLCNEYPPGQGGGLGIFTQTLGRALVARGHRVTVVGIYKSGNARAENDQGVDVVRLTASRLPQMELIINGLRLRRALVQIHRESPIDLIEGPELSFSMFPSRFLAPKLIRMHGGHHFFATTLGNRLRPWRSRLEFRSFAQADHLCAVSRFVAETTRTLLSLDGRPIEILPNSVNTSLFRPMPAEPETEGLILFVGRVVEKKGVRQLIQAMPQIIAAVPHARLWIFGGDGRDPTTGRSLTDLLQGLVSPGYRDRIVFKGTIENSQLPALIARAQVCVYPSHMEAQGIVILEGMAMGKPVVASRTGPGPELVKDGVSGLLCDPFDPVSIADKVITLLRDKGLRQRLGAQASRNVGEHFSTAVLVGRNEEFYDRCLR